MSQGKYGHDNSYKHFFSHKIMVIDRIKGFVELAFLMSSINTVSQYQ